MISSPGGLQATFCGMCISPILGISSVTGECSSDCSSNCSLNFSISSSNSSFRFNTLSILSDLPPPSSSFTRFSNASICSLVLCLIFRCASRSFARLRASWALLRCVTDLFPPRAPVTVSLAPQERHLHTLLPRLLLHRLRTIRAVRRHCPCSIFHR